MTNPLDEIKDAFQTSMDAIKVARRVLDRRRSPASNTDFYGMTEQEGHKRLDEAEEQLSKLVAFALFAAFERKLRDHLSDSLSPVSTSTTTPEELAGQLGDFLKEGVNNWRIGDVIDPFNPPAREQDIGNAKGVLKYRHKVAHGAAPPEAIPPKIVYAQLSEFLKNAGLTA